MKVLGGQEHIAQGRALASLCTRAACSAFTAHRPRTIGAPMIKSRVNTKNR